MINGQELRLGNTILFKNMGRINLVPCTTEHFILLEKDGGKDLFPVVLKSEILLRCGFIENKDYALLPQAREFSLVLPVEGAAQHQLFAWIKTNGECFGRATVNGIPASNNFYHLHSLQNLYYALTGKELSMQR